MGRIGPAQPADAGARLGRKVQWLNVSRESVVGVLPSPLPEQPWGQITSGKSDGGTTKLYLHVFTWHASGDVIAYGLASDVKRAYLLASPDVPLTVEKRDRSVVIRAAPSPRRARLIRSW